MSASVLLHTLPMRQVRRGLRCQQTLPWCCPHMLRTLALLLLTTTLVLTAAERTTPIVVEDLHGAWVIDTASLKADQKEAAKAAAAVEDYGINFTQRTCRVILSEDQAYAGMWRVDNATPTTATVVVQPKGGEERRIPITFDGKTLVLTDTPNKLPMVKAKK